MTNFDLEAFSLLNGLSGRWQTFDLLVLAFSQSHFFKGVLPMLVFWGAWFYPWAEPMKKRARLVAGLWVAVMAIAFGRALAVNLPFRHRPMHTDGLDLVEPLFEQVVWGEGLSSLPSDHATLYFAVATSLFFVSRLAGSILFAHAVLVVSLPRIIIAAHWPSDILAGAGIGIFLALVVMPPLSRLFERTAPAMNLARVAYLGYPLLFLASLQIATLFESTRSAMALLVAIFDG
ncbi:MAG: phosphatase PAP2 family protein [Rhodobacteraceae bacterium]|nr:phosphatase PAP2 family protein [Paracoccaceae bacterium]